MHWRAVVLILGFAVAVFAAYLNVQDEIRAAAHIFESYPGGFTEFQRYMAHVVLLWASLPFVVLSIYLIGLVLTRTPRLNSGAAAVFVYVTAGIYAFYALNGPTDPATSGHMHFMLVPILWGTFVCLPFSLYMLVRLGIEHIERRRQQNKLPADKEEGKYDHT